MRMLLVLRFASSVAASGPDEERRLDNASSTDSEAGLEMVNALREAAGLAADAGLDMEAAAREAVRLNATLGGKPLRATFGDGVQGSMTLQRLPFGVLFATYGLRVNASLVAGICGGAADNSTPPLFEYHIHDKWEMEDRAAFATGLRCGPKFTGGHWDPTAACSHSSGNPACRDCAKIKKPYSCSPRTFKWWKKDQYNPWDKHACELGDLSSMFGDLEAWSEPASAYVTLKGKIGVAQMSAPHGVVSNDHRRPCIPNEPGFEHATPFHGWGSSRPLSLINRKSIVAHCGSTFEAKGARLFCAELMYSS
uniref:Uncharacterized protein n=1 Tax=Alexandrium catenella TaxID=2925 RepID=A0A7S1S2I4_ALECA